MTPFGVKNSEASREEDMGGVGCVPRRPYPPPAIGVLDAP